MATVLVAVSVACVISAVALGATRTEAERALSARLDALAATNAARLALAIEGLRGATQTFFIRDRSVPALLHQVRTAAEADRPRALANLRATLDTLPSAVEWRLLAPTGVVLAASADVPVGEDASRSDCFQQLGVEGVSLTGLRVRPDGGGVAAFNVPLRDAGRALLGLVCVEQAVPLPAAPHDVEGAEVHVLDSHGRLLAAHADAESLHARAVGISGRNQPWSGRLEVPGHPASFAAFAPVDALGCGVWVEAPPSALVVRLARASTVSLSLAGACLLLGLALVVRSRRSAEAPAVAGPAPSPRSVPVPPRPSSPAPPPAHAAPDSPAKSLPPASGPGPVREPDEPSGDDLVTASRGPALSELLLDALEGRVLLIGPDFTVLRANTAARRRYHDVLASDAHALLEGAAGPCTTCPVCQAFASGEPVVTETSEGLGSFTELVHLQVLPVRSRAGAVTSVLRVARVVTEEKKLQAQLMLREKMSAFGLLAAGVAHEVGNPLAAISSQLRLAREAPEPGRTEATLDIVSKEVARIQELLRELVTFARRPRTGHALVSLDTVVEDVWRLINHDPRARSITIERVKSEQPPAVRAKEDYLVQVLLNLGLNAIDAMAEGGTLTFATAVEDGSAVVRVSDTGPGITAEVQARLFEPFFTTKDVGRGTGLGLFVSKGLVRELKGTLVVEKTGPGGTVFCLRLPLAAT